MSSFFGKHLAAGGSRRTWRKNRGFRLRLCGRLSRLVLIIGAVLSVTQALAFDGFYETLPKSTTSAPRYSPQSGLSCSIDTKWFDRWGYRQVRFDIQAKTAKPKDREISITLFASEMSQGNAEIKAEKHLTLSGGEKVVTGTLLFLPVPEEMEHLWWEIAIDGKVDPSISVDKGMKRRRGRNTGGLTGLNIIFSTLDQKDISGFSRIRVPASKRPRSRRRSNQINNRTTLEMGGDWLAYSTVTDSKENWLAYSSADVMLFSAAELKGIANKRTREFLILRQWVMAGGSLWVEQVTNGKEGLSQIEELLNASTWDFGIVDERKNKVVEGVSGWSYESLAMKSEDGKQEIRELTQKVMEGDLTSVANRLSEANSRGWYAMRSYGFGRVMAFPQSAFHAPDHLSPQEKNVAASQWKSRNWPSRHGLTSSGASRSFGNLLIPGVGVAPVNEFQFLITLFVLAIGPLNYWLLRRSQRLHLLVITTPLAALLVTVGLFAYALLSDGFGVKTRARSVTLLNQVTGEAASWSRVSQYAASAPRGGYVFPDDAAVYPILPTWGVLGGQGTTAREVVWQDGQQRLERGWLPTRTAVQHLVVRSCETTKEIRFSSDGKEASNRLGAEIDLLIVRDEAGDWLEAEKVAEGVAVRLASIKKAAAVVKLRLLVSANQPEFPIGAGDEAEETLSRFDSRSIRRRRRNQWGSSRLDENLLNKAIGRLSGFDGGEALDFSPRSYLAVTHQTVETPLGLHVAEGERIDEIGSFHLIVGKW